jgi:drug/metabolite transporter (DMT)-like permease
MRRITIQRTNLAWLAVGLLIFAATTAPIYIRFAQNEGVPSLSIITWRLILATILLTPFAWRQHGDELKSMSRHDWGWAMAAGAFHAFGLFCLFFALENTSVLVNGVLRRTTPLWTIMLEVLVLHVMFARHVWWGIGLTLLGGGLVAFGGADALDVGTRPFLGAGLSLLNAVTLSFYLVIGRRLRNKLSFLAYTWTLFVSATLVAIFFLLMTQTPMVGFTLRGYWWILVVTIVAQIAGHLPVNFAVRHFPATYMAVLLQISTVAAAVLAFFYFGEIPSLLQLVGSVIIIAGVLLVTVRKRPS